MNMMDDWHGGGMMIGMGLLVVLFWVAVIALIVLLVHWLVGRRESGPPESPLEILKRRYARGEIDRETFERMKRDLEEGGGD